MQLTDFCPWLEQDITWKQNVALGMKCHKMEKWDVNTSGEKIAKGEMLLWDDIYHMGRKICQD
jgi:hypothetical protein